jgi:phenylpyruvate tautomerase PptA (4-oxalocrotonate tautomerase family)
MPYLQLDLPATYPANLKKKLARRLGDLYAEVMQTTPSMVSVGFRELGEANLYRCGSGDPVPAVVVQCDIRQGRPAEQRLAFAQRLVDECVEHLGVSPDLVAVEFTQHSSDEMYRNGSWGRDWAPSEAVERG